MMAWAALSLWPVIAIALFRRLSLPVALCATIFGGYLLLPEKVNLDLPLIPAFDKHSIPVFVALLMTAIIVRQNRQKLLVLPGWLPRHPIALVLLLILLTGLFGTVLTNQDPLFYGPVTLPGTSLYDGFSFTLTYAVVLLPMFLARKVLATPDAQRILLLALAISALVYSIPALWEVRMSPQLHRQIYGFFQHSVFQQMRGDGFRPMVFLDHGLTVAMFFALAVLSAAVFVRVSYDQEKRRWIAALLWLFIVLVLCKSFGALLITLVILPIILLLSTRVQVWFAASIAVVVMTFPMLRAAEIVPVDRVVSFAENISPQRAKSLEFRLTHEDALLAKAEERPYFGWGGWSRNRVFDEKGRNRSVTDGEWIIHLGSGGWFKYVGFFGLLCWPLIGLLRANRETVDPVCAALALILCAKLIDLIPNSGASNYIWLIAGSLWGRLEMKALSHASNDLVETSRVDKFTRTAGPLKTPRGPLAQPVRSGPSYTRATSKIDRRRT